MKFVSISIRIYAIFSFLKTALDFKSVQNSMKVLKILFSPAKTVVFKNPEVDFQKSRGGFLKITVFAGENSIFKIHCCRYFLILRFFMKNPKKNGNFPTFSNFQNFWKKLNFQKKISIFKLL